MPKQVDHQQRREQIADAVFRLAADSGLDAVSLRHVAEEASVSMGRVQHYFTTKDEMLLFAYRTISERVQHRMGAAARALGAAPSGKALVRTMLLELLPISEAARAEAPVLVAFLARAVVHPELVAGQAQDTAALREFVAERLGAVAGDARFEAIGLLAIVDGLMSQLLVGQIDDETAVATLDYHLDRIFSSVSARRTNPER